MRAAAALAMAVSALAFYGLTASSAFGVRTIASHGAALSGDLAVVGALDLPVASTGTTEGGAEPLNVVTLATGPLAARVASLPAVASVTVTTALPDTVDVAVTEREPILVWSVGEHRFLADRDGRILADAAASDATPGATDAAAALPVVVDERAGSTGLAAGSVLDPIDLDVATRLASLTPADLGSRAKSLTVRATDATGWELDAPRGWTAIFGFYTQSVRPPDLVPGQVRLLRSLLAVREDRLGRAILASGEAGTYTLR